MVLVDPAIEDWLYSQEKTYNRLTTKLPEGEEVAPGGWISSQQQGH